MHGQSSVNGFVSAVLISHVEAGGGGRPPDPGVCRIALPEDGREKRPY